jgi:hypothetical protein
MNNVIRKKMILVMNWITKRCLDVDFYPIYLIEYLIDTGR